MSETLKTTARVSVCFRAEREREREKWGERTIGFVKPDEGHWV